MVLVVVLLLLLVPGLDGYGGLVFTAGHCLGWGAARAAVVQGSRVSVGL